MAEISRSALFGKLNSLCYQAIESATVFCKLRGNPYVELVHWLKQILELRDSDVHRIIKHFELNPSRLAKDLTGYLDKLPRGATSIDLSGQLEETVEQAWTYATLLFGEYRVRSGHLMVALLKTKSLRLALVDISKEFEKVKPEDLTDKFTKIIGGSCEDALQGRADVGVGGGGGL